MRYCMKQPLTLLFVLSILIFTGGIIQAQCIESFIIDSIVDLYTQKQDLSGNWIIDQRIGHTKTDNAGSVIYNVDPGEYIVTADLDGYNWGDAHGTEGHRY